MQRVLRFAPPSDTDADPNGAWESMCLVRAFHRYVKVTKPLRSGTNQLVVAFKEGAHGKEASKVTIARWFKFCVQEAYTLQKDYLYHG